MSSDQAIRDLYERLLDAWNRGSAQDFAASFADDGEVVGFDGSQMDGRDEIETELGRIFADHPTGSYVSKVGSVRSLGSQAALLRAVAGMVPAGQTNIEPKLNAVQTLVAEERAGSWLIVLFQNTPAQFHQRPDLAESLTNELRQELGA
jgi:uncharacterized protein (TIGR02246 family)